MKGCNGHKNYNHWKVSLWLSNDEGMYNECRHFMRHYGNKNDAARALLRVWNDYGITHTPDGVKYTSTTIRAAMRDI